MASKQVNIRSVFDTGRFTGYQSMVCFLCFLVTFLDGFDLTMIGVTLPKMAESLGVEPGTLGLALSTGQFGPILGAIVLGMLADRFGRKWMLVISAMFFGIFTFMIAFIHSPGELALYRFLAGIGLGGAVPNALAFGSEFAPSNKRATLITTMYAGMPGGSVAAAIGAIWLIPNFGWQSLYLIGGAVPVLIAILTAAALPESLEFMVKQGRAKDRPRILDIVGKIAPAIAAEKDVEFISTEQKAPGVPIKHLFMNGRTIVTLLLWVAMIGSLYSMWVLTTWAPALMKKTGASVQQYSLAVAGLHFGAFLATIFIGRVMDKLNPFWALAVGFSLSCVSLAAFGQLAGSTFAVVFIMAFLSGVFTNGSNNGFVAVPGIFYPLSIRGTGIGFAYAVGKIGAMLAPAVGGVLLEMNWSIGKICGVQALVPLLVAVLMLVLKGFVKAANRANEAQLGGKSESLA
jgi:MFS transporter, AAHS family, 4-hydroxybenzoate transporter